jgi:hypothetical protein
LDLFFILLQMLGDDCFLTGLSRQAIFFYEILQWRTYFNKLNVSTYLSFRILMLVHLVWRLSVFLLGRSGQCPHELSMIHHQPMAIGFYLIPTWFDSCRVIASRVSRQWYPQIRCSSPSTRKCPGQSGLYGSELQAASALLHPRVFTPAEPSSNTLAS